MTMVELKEPKSIENLNVLIIDDNLLVHDVVKQTLVELGLRNIKAAENAYYGLRLCAKTKFDVVLCAFNVKSDRDGFHILEEMKFKGYVSRSTMLIFLSTDTGEALVNSICELQPDDFWVKPLSIQQVRERFCYTLSVKQKLFNVYQCIDEREFSRAIYYIERHLVNPALKKYYPHLLRMKGECLLSLHEFVDAENYYRELLESHKNSWVYLGFVNALLKQNKIEEIEALIESMTNRIETRFATYDLLAQYYVENEDFKKAYDEIKKAAALSPRNIARNKKVWDLARLNHDQEAQFHATVNMAKFAKKSIHDSPELIFNVIRSGLDLAQTLNEAESYSLLSRIDKYIKEIEHDYSDIGDFKEQLVVVRARLLNARDKSSLATRLVDHQVEPRATRSIEDNLDKVKVYHELGKREEALTLLSAVKNQVACDSLAGAVTAKFVEQESQEKAEIHFTPKQLNGMAVEFFKKNKMRSALHSLEQALTLTPNSIKVAMSLLKVLVAIHRGGGLDKKQRELAKQTYDDLNQKDLSDEQTELLKEISDELTEYLEVIEVFIPDNEQANG